jgi:FOG: CheY-like receiver
MKIFKIVVVDDEPKITNTLCRILRNAGYVAYGAYEAEGALILCRHYSVDMLISDVNMPAISGIELARQVCRELPACHIVLFPATVTRLDYCRKQSQVAPALSVWPNRCILTFFSQLFAPLPRECKRKLPKLLPTTPNEGYSQSMKAEYFSGQRKRCSFRRGVEKPLTGTAGQRTKKLA